MQICYGDAEERKVLDLRMFNALKVAKGRIKKLIDHTPELGDDGNKIINLMKEYRNALENPFNNERTAEDTNRAYSPMILQRIKKFEEMTKEYGFPGPMRTEAIKEKPHCFLAY